MTSLLADDHMAVMLGAMIGHEITLRRTNTKIHKRLCHIGQILKKSGFGIDGKCSKPFEEVHRHFSSEERYQKTTGEFIRLAPDNTLMGNYSVWVIFKHLLTNREKVISYDKPTFIRIRSNYENSLLSVNYRAGERVLENSKTMYRMAELRDELCVLKGLETRLSEKVKNAVRRFNTLFSRWQKTDYDPAHTPTLDFLKSEEKDPLTVVNFGPISFVRVKQHIIVITMEHLAKLNALFKTWTNILFSLPAMSCRLSPLEFLEDYLSEIWTIVDNDVDFLGEVLKGARNVMVASLDKSDVLGFNMGRTAIQTLAPDRRDYALPIINFMRSAFISNIDAINMMNAYKAIPHPDTNLHTAFHNITGLTSPNTINPSLLPRFRGTLRRTIYRSLTGSKYDVRLEAKSDAGATLADAANRTQRVVSSICEMSTSAWSSVRFLKVRGLTSPEEIVLAPSDKSSQISPDFSEEDLAESLRWAHGEGSSRMPDFARDAGTINDAASVLRGTADWDTKAAIKRFEKVIRAHESFERSFGVLHPEEIPENDLKTFVENNPDARYLVGTEPKLGEYHKKVTRMFYMGEQELKTITQITERFARQISRKQVGVSIVKGYAARRKDLEVFSSAVLGPEAERQSVFVSFDMSEFSKKFPMALVREYGAMLAELTGQEWMRRIDLVFRAAVVIHNTRGYFNYLSGVKGCFEGFLNFVWSSIHAVIMEIALNSTGVSGMLLVYSDDGLLLFYPPGTSSSLENHRAILKIKQVYQDHGLIFHLGKTLVSTHVWEYLGDICYNGKLLPMWMKEMATVGILKNNRGLSPLRMRISSFEGQVAAAVSAGANVITASVLLRFVTADYLANFMMCDDNRLIETLLITPVALGGMRIRSPAELCINSDIHSVAEFVADLNCLMKFDAILANSIMQGVATYTAGVKPSASRLFMGNLISSSLPDTSGMSVSMSAIDSIAENLDVTMSKQLGKHPIGGKVEQELAHLLRSVENIDVGLLSSLLMAVPEWIKFSKSMALVRGSGAIRLIKRRELKLMQSKDTFSCSEAFKAWREIVTCEVTHTVKQRPYEFISNIIDRVNFGYSLRPLKRSGRDILSYTNLPIPDAIEVRYSPGSSDLPNDLHYKEPSVRFPIESSSLSWFSEATGDVEISSARKFLNVCASFLAYSPQSTEFLKYLGYVFRVNVPILLPGLVAGFQRRSAHRSTDVDVRLAIPKHFWSLSKVNYTGRLLLEGRALARADRVTYLEYARVLSSLKSYDTHPTGRAKDDRVIVYRWQAHLPELLLNMHNPMMIAVQVPMIMDPMPDIDRRTSDEFLATVSESINLAEQQRTVDVASWNYDQADVDDVVAVMSISINSLSRWIHDFVMMRGQAIMPMRAMPIPKAIQSTVFIKAIIGAVWMSLEPNVRGIVSNSISDIANVMENPITSFINPRLTAVWTASRTVRKRMEHVLRTLREIDHPILSPSEIDHIQPTLMDIPVVIAECVMSGSIFTPNKTIVILSSQAHANYMSESHRVAYRQIFSSTISALMSHIRNDAWTGEVVPVLHAMRINPDDILDWLIVCRPLLRASEHRTTHHPYNRKSAVIEMFKFYTALYQVTSRGIDTEALVRAHLDAFRLGRSHVRRVCERIRGVGARNEVGPDHQAIVTSGLNVESYGRLIAHWREYRHGRVYGSAPINNVPVLLGWINASLTAYFNAVIIRMVDQVVEIPTSMVTAVSNMPIIPSHAVANMLQMEVNMQFMSGINLMDDEVARSEGIRNLMAAHIENYCIRAGVSGLNNHIAVPAWMVSILVNGGYYNPDGPILMKGNDYTLNRVGYILKKFNTARAAFATYVSISRNGLNSLSLLHDVPSGQTYLIGVYANCWIANYPENHRGLVVTGEEHLDDLIPAMSFSNTAMQTRMSSMALTRSENPRERIDDFQFAVMEYARQNHRPSEVNDFSLFLQAALDLAKDSRHERDRVWSYTLFMHYRNSMEDIQRARQSYLRLRAVLNGPNTDRRTALVVDISSVTTWLQFVVVHSGSSLNVAHITTLIESCPEGGIAAEIRPTVTFHRHKTILEVEQERQLMANVIAPGNISNSLIIIETRALLPGIDDIPEEEEIDHEEVDLDNFF